MRLRLLLAAALVVVLGIAAATAGASGQRQQAGKLAIKQAASSASDNIASVLNQP